MSDEDDNDEGKILHLVPRQQPTAQPQIIGILSEMLERAKQGQIQSIAIAACLDEGSGTVSTIKWATMPNVPHRLLLVGALTLLERELLSDIHTRQ
jgi:hypothetical protein